MVTMNKFHILHCALVTARLKILLLQLLLGDLLLLWLVTLAEGLLLLHQADLDVAWTAHVGVNSTVSSVCSPSHLGSTVDLKIYKLITIHKFASTDIKHFENYF